MRFSAHARKAAGSGNVLSYLKEAHYGDTVRVERADGGDGVYYFRTYREDELCLEAMLRTVPREEAGA